MTPTHLDMFRLKDLGTGGYGVDMFEEYPGEPSKDFKYHCLELAARRKGIRYYMWFCLKEVLTGKQNITL